MRYAIDFGTSNSLLCAVEGNQVSAPLPLDPQAGLNGGDPQILRSIVYYAAIRETYFGVQAVKEFLGNEMEGRLMRSFKRFLPSRTFTGTTVGTARLSLEEVIAAFLSEIRRRANAVTGQDVTSVVMGRPALFAQDPTEDALAESRLLRASQMAGFKEVEFVPEPLAAAFSFKREIKGEELVFVADFGGGTSDFTVIKLSPQKFKPSDVLAIGGVPYAGDALDGDLMRHRVSRAFGADVEYRAPFGSNVLKMPKALMEHLCSTAHIPLLSRRDNADFLDRVKKASLGPNDAVALEALETLISNQLGFAVFEAIESGKRELSNQSEVEIKYDYPSVRVRTRVTQPEFTEMTEFHLAQITGALDDTLRRAGVKPQDIDRVCCTGGTARAKVIRDQVAARFGAGKIEEFRNYTSIVEGLGQFARLDH